MGQIIFTSSVSPAASDNAACPKCGGTKPTCCRCPDPVPLTRNRLAEEFVVAAIEAAEQLERLRETAEALVHAVEMALATPRAVAEPNRSDLSSIASVVRHVLGPQEGINALYQKSPERRHAEKQLDEIRNCDKCDLCEDHHG